MARPPSQILKTVSYTHLDVYKRQPYGGTVANVILVSFGEIVIVGPSSNESSVSDIEPNIAVSCIGCRFNLIDSIFYFIIFNINITPG